MRELGRELKPERLIDQFAALVDKDKEELCQRGRHSLERSMLMELLYRYCRLSQPEIGRLVGGVDYSAVSQARKRLQVKLKREPKLKRRFEEIAIDLSEMSRIKI
jgi:chromosomal replication initiation ATPase DnaA